MRVTAYHVPHPNPLPRTGEGAEPNSGENFMFKKILIANRGDDGRQAGAAKPKCLVREAHAGDFDPMEKNSV